MRRLSGMDAMFLYNEVPTQHMHTVKLAVFEPPASYSFEAEKRHLAERLHLVPPFRWRIAPTPLALNHPLMIEDPDFDLDLHFHRAALPHPGGRRELCEFISELASRPLDRTRPLWEIWMVERLEGGQVACVMKVHHTLADGVATAEMLNCLLSTRPGEPPPPDDPPWQPETLPSRVRRVWMALRDLVPFLVAAVPRLVRSIRATRRRKAAHAGAEPAARAYHAPDTSLNGVLSSHRRFTFETLSLAEIRAVKSAFDATINDVVVAVVAGALRRYLLERGELPGRPLVATLPVSTRTPEQSGSFGNHVAAMYVNLCTQVEDPLQRFRALQRAIAASKREFADAEGAHLADFLELVPPPLASLMFSRSVTLMKRMGLPSSANVIISNVPGPREQLYSSEAPMRAFFSIGPVLEGVGLNITGWSYQDQLNVAVLADRKMVPDPWRLNDLLRDALLELSKLATEQRALDPAATRASERDGGN